MDVVAADGLTREYGETVALDGVSLSVSKGEVFGLVGPNGAGKTTLVRALTGTTDAEGTVELFGADPRNVEKERIGLLPQEFDPPDRLTARELITYYRGLYDDGREVEELLADVGMTDSAETYYENLSGGQKRRTCVAATLVNDPELLILDEPTTGIDPAGRRQLWRLLTDLAEAGTTIFITTHYMEEAQQLADRVGLLAGGELVALDTPSELIAEYGGDSLLYIDGEFEESVQSLLDYETSLDDDRLTVRNVRPEAIGSITATLDEAGVEYESLTWTEPDLEDVYLKLTGQTVTASGQILEDRI
ncbi:ABC transporter ATP-binding protein [Halovenus sp. HT40]|uniref:ABC transporter ATP-binding protein n=1 Tax=Halovenus sp. HT40 TaxID=3126691 RepID=UPI00300EF0A9